MKAVILAGGYGTRLSEETDLKPKPMVEVGPYPIVWHIMKIYSNAGVRDFIILCGYKGYVLKEYFSNYFLHTADLTIHTETGETKVHRSSSENWNITLVDTGEGTQTGGRLKRIAQYLTSEEDFCFTYGDGLASVNIKELVKFHKAHGKLATMTVVRPPSRFGTPVMDSDDFVSSFQEKPVLDSSWINGGFFVLKPRVLDYIQGDEDSWEQQPLKLLSADMQLKAFRHFGYWQSMDTLREKRLLNDLWAKGEAPWKSWN